MAKITVVDDEQSIRQTLSLALEKEGHKVCAYKNGEEAWANFCREEVDLMILDIMMPRMDGLELCRKIRSKNEAIPLMFLSSKDEEFDRILGLEVGGDDYLCKPFSLRELTTRVKALLRRSAVTSVSASSIKEDKAETIGNFSFYNSRYQVLLNEKLLPLTITEFRILKSLAEIPGSVRSREQLISAAFPEDNYVSDRSIDSHIKRIRKKMAAIYKDIDCIETVYGLGYRLNP
ncbi:MAG: response regulator transcription factor [Spirochaetales bacterium]|nr:response regulator transcription factor [Spirochaetales bacterium]